MNLINKYEPQLNLLCEQFHVESLYAFGSVIKDQFNEESDVDLLVKFSGVDPLEYFDNYWDFKNELEKLFSRKVDLLEIQTLTNPILKRSINRDKVLIYGRENSEDVFYV